MCQARLQAQHLVMKKSVWSHPHGSGILSTPGTRTELGIRIKYVGAVVRCLGSSGLQEKQPPSSFLSTLSFFSGSLTSGTRTLSTLLTT